MAQSMPYFEINSDHSVKILTSLKNYGVDIILILKMETGQKVQFFVTLHFPNSEMP